MSLNYKELSKKVTDALAKETTESLTNWLNKIKKEEMEMVEINFENIDTWLEPYIQWKFPIVKKFKKRTKILFTQHEPPEVITIENEKLNFIL